MHQQKGDRSCTSEAIGGRHFGPVIVYMSKVDDATKADGSSDFFKIGQYGYTAEDKTWGTDILNKNCGQFKVTIPASIAPGDYLLRAEAIALHTASQLNGAQPYVSCYQLRVSGSGSLTPAGVKFPGAYSETDAGIRVDIWSSNFKEYTLPGPPMPKF
jgi:lytic cellulose monooxygenase (C1-hydroxylating)